MRYLRHVIILLLLTNCVPKPPMTIQDVKKRHKEFEIIHKDWKADWMEMCKKSFNVACQLHGKEAVYE